MKHFNSRTFTNKTRLDYGRIHNYIPRIYRNFNLRRVNHILHNFDLYLFVLAIKFLSSLYTTDVIMLVKPVKETHYLMRTPIKWFCSGFANKANYKNE